MRYIDGYVLSFSKKNLKTYVRMAETGATMWMKQPRKF
jgi:uncharacterized protein YbaA (DUF1428 family)